MLVDVVLTSVARALVDVEVVADLLAHADSVAIKATTTAMRTRISRRDMQRARLDRAEVLDQFLS